MAVQLPQIDWGLHLDYGWFLAAVCWVGALAGFASRRTWGATGPWLMAFAGVNLVQCAMEILAVMTWPWFVPKQQSELWDTALWGPRIGWDLGIGLAPPLAGFFLGMAALSRTPRYAALPRTVRLGLVGLGLMLVVNLGAWRVDSPFLAGLVGSLAVAGVVAWLLFAGMFRSLGLGRGGDMGLVLWGLMLFASTAGPLAYGVGLGRRFYDIAPFTHAAQLVALAGAVTIAHSVWRTRLGASGLWLGTRSAWWLLATWFTAGFFFLHWSTRHAQRDFEDSLLLRARTTAAFLDRASLAEGVGPGFQLGKIQRRDRTPAGELTFTPNESVVASPACVNLRAQLKKSIEVNVDVWSINMLVPRDGWLAMPIIWPSHPSYYHEVYLERPAPAWTENLRRHPEGFVQLPKLVGWGNVVRAFVPIVVGEAPPRTVGWLDFEIITTKWASSFTVARLQSMGVVLSGVLLWVTGLGLRLRMLEKERIKAEAAAAHEADQAKGTLLANVSHELRTPLQNILGYCELLQNEVTGERGLARLGALRQQGKVMVRVVNDLLDLSAIESGAFRFTVEPTDLRRLVQETVDGFRTVAAAKKLGLVFVGDPTLPDWVLADAGRIQQVVNNLVSNAVKFTDQGRIEVTLLAGARDGNQAVIELLVADTGPGIPPAEQARLFKPFSRLSTGEQKEGSGLGLALSAALCRQAGGGLTVESDGSRGTRFRARWQLSMATAPAEDRARPAAGLSGRRILVVDDNRLVRELFVGYLEQCGVACEQAGDGTEALRLATEKGFDAVVLDLALPGAGGLDVATRLRADPSVAKNLVIVGVSAHAGRFEREQARLAGFDTFLAKPVDLAELAGALSLSRPSVHVSRLQELTALFHAEVPVQATTLADLLRRRDWPAVVVRAHHLRNSAVAVEDRGLFSACADLEDAAAAGDAALALQAWSKCLLCLSAVLGEETRGQLGRV